MIGCLAMVRVRNRGKAEGGAWLVAGRLLKKPVKGDSSYSCGGEGTSGIVIISAAQEPRWRWRHGDWQRYGLLLVLPVPTVEHDESDVPIHATTILALEM